MSFLRLANKLAQAHAVQGGHAKIASHPPMTPARRPPKSKIRELHRPGNNFKAKRTFVESPKRGPLSQADGTN